MLRKRDSPWEWSGSGIVTSSGSPKIVIASAKPTPCFAALVSALLGSHSNSIARSVWHGSSSRVAKRRVPVSSPVRGYTGDRPIHYRRVRAISELNGDLLAISRHFRRDHRSADAFQCGDGVAGKRSRTPTGTELNPVPVEPPPRGSRPQPASFPSLFTDAPKWCIVVA